MIETFGEKSAGAAPVTIAILAFDGVRSFQLSVPLEIFDESYGVGEQVKLRLCSSEGGSIRTSTGFVVNAEYGLDELASADVVIVPSWKRPHQRPSDELIAALQTANANGAIVVGLCLGAFILAEAGLLDGKRATTHWAFAEDFRRSFPQVDLDEIDLYVDQDSVITSAGVAASIDCCLHLAERLFGAQTANRIARSIVSAPHRAGGQPQFIDRPIPVSNRDSRLRSAMYEIVRTIGEKHSIDSVASDLGMSRRNFTRLFQQTMGVGFREWLTNMRLALAARSLEATSRSVEQIALETGFGSVVTFRAQFTKRYGVSPVAWRRSFNQNG